MTTATTTATEPRIYVASLSDYNSGRLHGAWIGLEGKSEDDVMNEVNAMLAKSKEDVAEEYAIHDHEGFEGLRIEEYTGIAEVVRIAQALEEHADNAEAFGFYAGDVGLDYALDHFEEAFSGEWDSEKEFTENLVDSLGYLEQMPEFLRNYFDYEAFQHDLFIGDYSSEKLSNGNVAVFRRDV